MHKSQQKVAICSLLHVPTRRWTTFVVFRQKKAPHLAALFTFSCWFSVSGPRDHKKH